MVLRAFWGTSGTTSRTTSLFPDAPLIVVTGVAGAGLLIIAGASRRSGMGEGLELVATTGWVPIWLACWLVVCGLCSSAADRGFTTGLAGAPFWGVSGWRRRRPRPRKSTTTVKTAMIAGAIKGLNGSYLGDATACVGGDSSCRCG